MKWKEMSTPFKILRVIFYLCFAAAACLFAYEVAGWFNAVKPWETGSDILDVLSGVLLILEGVNKLQKDRGFALTWIILGSLKIVLDTYFFFI